MTGLPKTRILFTENGRPVEGLSVRSTEGEDPVQTDRDGQVAVSLHEGRQTLSILKGETWIPQVVHPNRESSLIVVDLAKKSRETGEFKPPDPSTSFLDIGKLNLGERYIYEEIIGRGGMSVVLRAQDRLLNREVAVKVLSQELQAHSEAQQIFLTEARNLATLSHPNLVSVHDICKVDDQVFMVIEYVEGESLEKLVSTVRGFNETVALQTIIQMARVVGYLHDHNIIHRDIKPANAMLRNDGTVKLIDFGLARHFDELQVRGTRVRGTPAYMSPEQVKGEPLSPACDVYQLGVCLFEALTGRLPFSGKGDMGYQHVHTKAPSVLEFAPTVSPELAELLSACLSKDPADRPQNGQELLRRLQVIYQHSGAAGGNLYKELQRDKEEDVFESGEAIRGYTTSDLRLMEAAGKHLRTSQFSARTLSDFLLDPENDSRIVIQTGPRWSMILGACLITSTVAAVLVYGLMSAHVLPPSLQAGVVPPTPSIPTRAPISAPVVKPTPPTKLEPIPTTPVSELAEPVPEPVSPEPVPTPAEVEQAKVPAEKAQVVPKVAVAKPAESEPKRVVETARTETPKVNKSTATAVIPDATKTEPEPEPEKATQPKPIKTAKKLTTTKKGKRGGLFAPKRRTP